MATDVGVDGLGDLAALGDALGADLVALGLAVAAGVHHEGDGGGVLAVEVGDLAQDGGGGLLAALGVVDVLEGADLAAAGVVVGRAVAELNGQGVGGEGLEVADADGGGLGDDGSHAGKHGDDGDAGWLGVLDVDAAAVAGVLDVDGAGGRGAAVVDGLPLAGVGAGALVDAAATVSAGEGHGLALVGLGEAEAALADEGTDVAGAGGLGGQPLDGGAARTGHGAGVATGAGHGDGAVQRGGGVVDAVEVLLGAGVDLALVADVLPLAVEVAETLVAAVVVDGAGGGGVGAGGSGGPGAVFVLHGGADEALAVVLHLGEGAGGGAVAGVVAGEASGAVEDDVLHGGRGGPHEALLHDLGAVDAVAAVHGIAPVLGLAADQAGALDGAGEAGGAGEGGGGVDGGDGPHVALGVLLLGAGAELAGGDGGGPGALGVAVAGDSTAALGAGQGGGGVGLGLGPRVVSDGLGGAVELGAGGVVGVLPDAVGVAGTAHGAGEGGGAGDGGGLEGERGAPGEAVALVVVADVSGAGGVIGLLPDALGAALTADGARVAGGTGERDEGGEEGLGPGHATGRGGGAGGLAVVLGLLPEAGLVAETVGEADLGAETLLGHVGESVGLVPDVALLVGVGFAAKGDAVGDGGAPDAVLAADAGDGALAAGRTVGGHGLAGGGLGPGEIAVLNLWAVGGAEDQN